MASSAVASSSAGPEPRSENAVLQEFQARRDRLNEMWSKINELSAEVAEHEIVIGEHRPSHGVGGGGVL